MLDRLSVLDTIRLLAQSPYFSFDFPGFAFSIGNTVQLVQPAKYLTVGQRNDLIVPAGLSDGQREPPFGLPQPAAMQLEYVLLTY